MDFYEIKTRSGNKKGLIEVYPDFIVTRTKDLMARGKSFYAVWDEDKGMWSTDEYDVARIVDKDILSKFSELNDISEMKVVMKTMKDYSSGSWDTFKRYLSKIGDNSHQLDDKIIFANTEVTKKDYCSRRLPYSMEPGPCPNYEKIISTLYDKDEREKLEWAIGSIISGDAKKIQKFIVLYGDAGAGKSTILNIIQMMFDGYYTTFDAGELTSNNQTFATDAFANDPLIAIQHDGDLSKIKDNSKLNSIVSHEEIIINEKFKGRYSTRANCFLFMATNKPVKITEAKSGLIRRLIDVKPSGRKLSSEEYDICMSNVQFELGAIANHCLNVYLDLGKTYYNSYKPIEMMYKTDPFFNFVEDSLYSFKDGISLKQAYALYKEYNKESGEEHQLQMYKFREELKNYFKQFAEVYIDEDGNRIRSYFLDFDMSKFEKAEAKKKTAKKNWLSLETRKSIFDYKCADCPAQQATTKETPRYKWDNVTTSLKDINTNELHYVKVPENHIVIDFDLKDEHGNKSLELNLKAAESWPETYAEVSKGGQGLHLHYIYNGDVNKLSKLYAEDIEIKVFTGNSSLRRKLSLCNNIDISTISSNLPLRKEKKMTNAVSVANVKQLRALIKKNLNKEIHPYTKPSIDFIKKILDDAYENGIVYDVTDMRPAIVAFAASSSHQSDICLQTVAQMQFKSETPEEIKMDEPVDDTIIFYDCEVFPNLFLVNWKKQGKDHKVVRMINPTPNEIEQLTKRKLVGFNCRRYDNHIMYARMMGYSNEELFRLSQRIINTEKGANSNCFFGPAYNMSYADIYDFSSKKQSLKKFEIELGIHHQECRFKWDEPVPEEYWTEIAEYCDYDVLATEAVWDDRQGDFIARQILADLSGLTVNDTTRSHVTKIIFGDDKNPELVYTDLSKEFPGYSFERGEDGKMHNMYRGIDLSFGGLVIANPGMYGNVALLDVESLHPHSAIALNYFGKYTERVKDLIGARMDIKHKDIESAKKRLGGALKPYLDKPELFKDLTQALKIVINSIYGYTCATFDNVFKDKRNVNNIIALRGALFMKTLQDEVEKRGFVVAHIKTDSIKIPDATPEIIEFCMNFAKKYGYSFKHEATYEKMCLVNDAVYIAKYQTVDWCRDHYGYIPGDNEDHPGQWTATGTQFQIPYVFKTLFTHEKLEFSDFCETKSVTGSLYLDFNEKLPDVSMWESIKEARMKPDKKYTLKMQKIFEEYANVSDEEVEKHIQEGHDYVFIGKVGLFCPIKPECGGGLLLRCVDDKFASATDAKDYRWMEAEMVKMNGLQDNIDISYYQAKADAAIDAINAYGDFFWFASDDPYEGAPFNCGKIKAA